MIKIMFFVWFFILTGCTTTINLAPGIDNGDAVYLTWSPGGHKAPYYLDVYSIDNKDVKDVLVSARVAPGKHVITYECHWNRRNKQIRKSTIHLTFESGHMYFLTAGPKVVSRQNLGTIRNNITGKVQNVFQYTPSGCTAEVENCKGYFYLSNGTNSKRHCSAKKLNAIQEFMRKVTPAW